jgi:hypothetical protein
MAALLIRRLAIVFALALALHTAASAPARAADSLERAYTDAVRKMAHGAGIARPDGYIWAYDSAQLLRFAAIDADLTRYLELRDAIVKRFVLTEPPAAEARDDVVWRVRDGVTNDASCTTEALALADALLTGAQTFKRPDDRDLAHLIAAAYMRHATTERGIWFIRNYFNFATQTYANNSFLVDYLPDVLADAGETDGALRSYALLDRAMGPAGLFYELVQPEIETAFPGAGLAFFSPNAISSITNACGVALFAAHGRPALAKRVLAFGVAHAGGLKRFYDVRTGAARNTDNAGTPAYACLTRLAVKLGDETARRKLDPYLRANAATQLASGTAGPDTATAVVFALRRSDRAPSR